MKNRVILTGANSGGHLLPLLAVAKELNGSADLFLLCDGKDFKLLFSEVKIKSYRIISGKFSRFHGIGKQIISLIFNIIKTVLGILQALWLVGVIIRPKAIFSKGGYSTIPVVIAGWLLRVPIIVHESDLTIGLANKLSLRLSKKICVSFPLENYNLPLQKIVYSGHILRSEVISPNQSKVVTLKRELNLNENKPTIVVTGGSLGSLSINKMIVKIIPEISHLANIIHFCGRRDYKWLYEFYEKMENRKNYHLIDFSSQIIYYFIIADLIITRAGSNTLAEIAALKKPAIIIPYPHAAADHQASNARYLESGDAGVVIAEKDLSAGQLLTEVKSLLSDKERLKMLGENAYKLNQFDGAKVICGEINKIMSRV